MTERRSFLIVVIVAAIAFTVLFIQIHNAQNEIEQTNRELARQVEQNQQTIAELERAVKLLCNRGHILDTLVVTAIGLIEQRLAADIKAKDWAAIKADRGFLHLYVRSHLKLTSELTRRDSPCAIS